MKHVQWKREAMANPADEKRNTRRRYGALAVRHQVCRPVPLSEAKGNRGEQ